MNRYILTFDYELFGSGKGDVIRHLVEPTYKILRLLSLLDIKATFFVEQLEVDAIIDLKHEFPVGSKEYNDAISLEQQLTKMVVAGHDIQLHLHPQWYQAKYSNKRWYLNFQWWRFSSLPNKASNSQEPSKVTLLAQGKASLENFIRKIKRSYTCNAFRAGGYNIGTDKETITALLSSGFKLDSSICPGYLCTQGLSQYDYTGAPLNRSYWLSDTSLNIPKSNQTNAIASIIELPLLTAKSNLVSKISIARLFNAIRNRSFKAISYKSNTRINTQVERSKANTNFDVCLASFTEIRKFNKKISALDNSQDNVITLIGHPKDFNFFSPMERILSKIPSSEFITTADIVAQVENV